MLDIQYNIGQYLGFYAALSLVYFIIPRSFKSRFTNPIYVNAIKRNTVLHISHRGGSRENLENTIQAFDHAVKLGTDVLEMDVCFTKDNKVIVVHDSLLSRVTGIERHSHEFDYSDLPKFLEQVRVDFAPDLYIRDHHPSIKLPLLEDVLKRFPNTLMNIEIKTPNHSLNKAVNDLIKKFNRESLTIWGARHKADSDALYKLNPSIPRFFSFERVILTYILYVTGLLPFFPIQEDSLQVPLFTDDMYKWKLSMATSLTDRMKVHVYHLFVWTLNSISRPLFWHLNRRGVAVFYWVLNEEREYQIAINQGVNGIMTDNPSLLKQFLKK